VTYEKPNLDEKIQAVNSRNKNSD